MEIRITVRSDVNGLGKGDKVDMMDILAWWWKGGGWCKDRGEKEEEVVNGENGVVKQWCDIKGVWIAEISGKGKKWNGCVSYAIVGGPKLGKGRCEHQRKDKQGGPNG